MISEVELTINSRQIVAMYEDSVEEAITPNHLLFGEKLCARNMISDEMPEIDPTRGLKYLRTVQSHFWKRWKSEYLTSLREYQKSKQPHKLIRIPKVNDIVIMKDDKLPRQQWRLGRITDLIIGRDKKICAVKLLVSKTGTIILRPIILIYPLECDVNKTESTIDVEPGRKAAVVGETRRKFNA